MAVVAVLEVMQKVEKTTFYGGVRQCSSTYAEDGNAWQKMKTYHGSQL